MGLNFQPVRRQASVSLVCERFCGGRLAKMIGRRFTQSDFDKWCWLAIHGLFVLGFCILSTGCRPSVKEIFQQNQAMIWDAAGSYYLEHDLKPGDPIEFQSLKVFFGLTRVPLCPLGTHDYAPFKLFDGPRCPHVRSGHGSIPVPEKISKIKRNLPGKCRCKLAGIFAVKDWLRKMNGQSKNT